MARIGYARVSTLDQDLEAQVERLRAEGCGVVRSEKVSGGSREGRGELETVLSFLRGGDELVVTRLDRLGRDTRDVLNLIHEAERRTHKDQRCPLPGDASTSAFASSVRPRTVFRLEHLVGVAILVAISVAAQPNRYGVG